MGNVLSGIQGKAVDISTLKNMGFAMFAGGILVCLGLLWTFFSDSNWASLFTSFVVLAFVAGIGMLYEGFDDIARNMGGPFLKVLVGIVLAVVLIGLLNPDIATAILDLTSALGNAVSTTFATHGSQIVRVASAQATDEVKFFGTSAALALVGWVLFDRNNDNADASSHSHEKSS
jgi:hypothetical protein